MCGVEHGEKTMDEYGLVYMVMKIEFDRIPTSLFHERFDIMSDSLRKVYPISFPIKEMKVFKLDMQNVIEGKPEITNFGIPMMTFLSPDKNVGIRIAPDFLVIHTKKYNSFTDISQRTNNILKLLIENYDIAFYATLGIRYVNKIECDEEYEFSKKIKMLNFLQPPLCDWGRSGGNMSSIYYDSYSGAAIGLNTGIMIDGPVVSPDLIEIASDIIDKNKTIDGVVAHIDIDVSLSSDNGEMKKLITQEVIDNLSTLRNLANKAYREIFI